MKTKNTRPRPKPVRRRAEDFLRERAEVVDTDTDSESDDDVQISPGTPDMSDASGMRRSLSSPKLKKQKLLGDAGEGVDDDLESWADELESELLRVNEHEPDVSDESLRPVDVAGKSLPDKINIWEFEERVLHEKNNSIERSKSTTDQPAGFIDNYKSPLGITIQSWNNPGLVSSFKTSSANINGGSDQWWKLSTDIENYYNTTIFNSICDESSWIENHNPWRDFEDEMMGKTGLEQHESCATGAGRSGCTSSPFPCQSGNAQTDPFEAMYNRQSSTVHDQQSEMNPPPPSSTLEVLLIDSLGPIQYELHRNDELIIID